MTKNEGNLDRALRIIVGLVALSLTQFGPQSNWGYLGVVPLLTGIIGFCPLYKILGLNTCPLKR